MSRNPFHLTPNDILEAFNYAAHHDRNNSNLLPTRSTNSTALENIQGYGRVSQSPSWNVHDDHNTASSLTPSHANSSKPFNSFNLTSVDEEDEFLYGDSNSVSEEQLPVKEESIENNPSRFDSGWSDEEDPYGELPKVSLNKLNSRLRKNIPSCDSQNKIKETKNFSGINKEIIEIAAPIKGAPEQKYISHGSGAVHSSLPLKIEKNQFSEVNTSLIREKSKYHAAAELLKKRFAEKNNSSSENLSAFPGISKNELALDESSVHPDSKMVKLPVKRSTPTLNKKHVDNIRDYITGSRKRTYPSEEFLPEKHPRYEASRSSPSRHYSPQKSSSGNYKSRSSHGYSENDRIKYTSRYRSPSYESEKQHHSRYPESRRRYSPSPKRRSRSPDYKHRRRSPERSTDYGRYKDRSPKSRRSRSRGPGYYSSRSKTYDKKTRITPKKSNQHSKKKGKSNYSSGDSFCSLSLDSSSNSSDSSSESSEEEKKPKKHSVKTTKKDDKKHETEITVLKDSNDTHAKSLKTEPDSKDLSKEIHNVFDGNNSNELLDPANLQHILSVVQPSRDQQLLLDFFERQITAQQQQPGVASDSSTFASPNVNIASSLQMPVIQSSESYLYPTVPAAPVQYIASQMTGFQPMIPSATFSTPPMAAPSPDAYGSYLQVPTVPSNNPPYMSDVVQKSVKVRPSTLKTIHPLAPPVSSSNITVIPSNLPIQNTISRSKIQESNDVKIQETPKYVDQKNSNFKEKSSEKNTHEKNSSSKLVGESTSEQNKLLIIEKFKKMKTDRVKALNKAKSASEDLIEMRKFLDETFGKKVNKNDKMLYNKCKNQFNLSLDISFQADKEARRADEILNSFKSKLPTALQQEVAKIKLEPYRDEPVTNEIISCLDQGDHTCCDCCIYFNNVKEFLYHIQTTEHKEKMMMSKQDWKKDFIKEIKKDDKADEQKKTVLKPVKGAEFLKPLNGFYCSLCKEVFLEESTAEQHLKGHQHFVSYENFTTKRAPLYEMKRLFKRYIKMVISTRQNNAEKIKNREAAEKMSKEILLKEKSKEITYEELEEKESEGFSSSNNQMTANIKLNLSEKDNDKSDEKKNLMKELESKNPTKFIYIGKAPNYKKVPSKLWVKKDNVSNLKESDASPPSSNVTRSVEKDSQKSQSHEVKPLSSLKKVEKSNYKNNFVEVKSASENAANNKYSELENKNSGIKQEKVLTEKSSLNSSDSSKYKVQLSEIKLPEISSLPSSSNANIPQPMDIDNSQDVHNKPKSEEEKDFLLLGIKREDFQPLVMPVPPPTSMVSYPNLSNVQTFSSSTSCNTTSTSSINHSIINSLDFSVPPPNIAPYQNNPAPPSVYVNQNNTQNAAPYSYPTNNSQMSVYSNPSQVNLQTSYQTMPPFSTPPPAFRNPPPRLPYSNTGNVQPASQFSNSNNLPYTSYANSVPLNINNQTYQPSVYSVPVNNQAHFPVQNTGIVPPGSEYDTSFLKNNFNAVTTAPSYVHQSKISPVLKKVGNLTVIVPEKTQLQVKESVHDSKPKKSEEIKVITQDKNKTEKSKNTTNEDALKTKPVGPIKKNIYDTTSNNEKMNKHHSKIEVKGIINECIKKVEKSSNIISLSSSLVIAHKVTEDNKNVEEFVTVKNNEKILEDSKVILKENTENVAKKTDDVALEARVINIEIKNANDNGESNAKICGEQISAASVEIAEKIVENSSKVCSLADNPNKTDEIVQNKENIENIAILDEKIMISNTQDDKVTLKENTENITKDSVFSGSEQIISNDKISDNVLEFELSDINTENDSGKTNTKIYEVQLPAESKDIGGGTFLEKSSNIICSVATNSSKTDDIAGNGKNMESIGIVSEKNMESSAQDSKLLKESTKNIMFTAEISKHEQNNYANKNIPFEKCEYSQLSNISIGIKEGISNSCNEKDIQNKNIMSYADTDEVLEINEKSFMDIHKVSLSTNDTKESNCYAISDIKMKSKDNENVYEESIKISEKQIFADSMEIDDSTVIEKPSDICLADSPNNTGEVIERNENDSKESIKVNKKQIFADSMEVDSTQSTESQSNVSVPLKAQCTAEFLSDQNNENQEKECDKFIKENDKVASEKNVEHSLSAENSNNNEIKKKTDGIELLHVSTLIGNKIMDDSCMDKKVLNENVKNCITLLDDVNRASGKNENMVHNSDVEHMPVIDIADSDLNDSNLTDVSYTKDEDNEIPNLKCGERIFIQELKVKNDVASTFSDYSFSDLSNIICIETDDKKTLQSDKSDLMINKEHVKENAQETKSSELFNLPDTDVDESNQIFPREEKSETIYFPMKTAESSEESTSDKVMQDWNKLGNVPGSEDSKILEDELKAPLQSDPEILENKMEVSLESESKEKGKTDTCHVELSAKPHTDICTSMKNAEGSASEEVMENIKISEDLSQDMHLKLPKSCEDSSILEDSAKTPLQSSYQDQEKLEESKMEVSLDSGDNPVQDDSEVSVLPGSSLSSTTRSGRLIRRPDRLGL